MKRRRLGHTDLEVSEIGFGALEIGRPWGLPIEGDFVIPSERDAGALLDRVLDLGINFIDTAPAYGFGHGEEVVGKAIQGRRDKVILATKCGLSWTTKKGRPFIPAASFRSTRRPER